MEAAGLEGIQDVRQGKGITFRPYGLVSALKSSLNSGNYDWKLDGGFDIYKSFTPNLVGAVSLNMDFAETEVDERRINLTRTATRRPVVFDLTYSFGNFYSGSLNETKVGLTVKLDGYANLSLSADLVRGRLPEGRINQKDLVF